MSEPHNDDLRDLARPHDRAQLLPQLTGHLRQLHLLPPRLLSATPPSVLAGEDVPTMPGHIVKAEIKAKPGR